MSAKVKLISFISAFVLVLGIMIIGVLSAEQVQVNIGGSVSFNATNVYARVSGNISGAQTGNKTFSTLTYSASETTGDESDWANLALEFTEIPDPIIITITVENLSTQRTLTANLTNSLSTSGLNIAITRDTASYTSATNVELGTAGSSTDSTTFTLTLTVANLDEDLTDATFGYILNMFDESVAPVIPSPASDFTYTFDDSEMTATIASYIGSDTEVVLPTTVNKISDTTATEGSDYRVTAIAAGSSSSGPFYSVQSTLTSITIPETIDTIKYAAFMNCIALTEINYNATAATTSNAIFYHAGQNGTGITVNIGANVTKIPANLFNSSNITIVNFAEGSKCEGLDTGAFLLCDSLTSITIPSSVTSIGQQAFYKCSNLTTITFEGDSHLTNIESEAFLGCSSLTSIILPSNVTSIGTNAFRDSGLTSITIPEGVTSIYTSAFRGCSSLISITIPTSIIMIRMYTFQDCSSLTTITIPDSVTIIMAWAFSNCSGLTSITIPEGVTSIESDAFSGCNFSEVTIDSSYAYQNAGDTSSACGYLLQDANTVYVNANLVGSYTASSYLTSNFTCSDAPNEAGYYVYTRN